MKPSKKPARKAGKSKTSSAVPNKKTEAPVSPKRVRKTLAPLLTPKPVAQEPPPTETKKPKKSAVVPVTSDKPLRPVESKVPLDIPPILLEGDTSPAPSASGPGQRYALGPTPPAQRASSVEEPGDLPASYGSERLWLTARDPHWLYAAWDMSNEQQQRYNALSARGHLIVRTFKDSIDGEMINETEVHPESRHWFVHVGRGGTRYQAELGYRDRADKWMTIATSMATLTPPDAPAAEAVIQFATVPPEVTFERILEVVTAVVSEHVPLVEAIQQLRTHGYKDLPPVSETPMPGDWTPAQARALAEVVSMDSVRRVWIGSLEVTELVRRHLEHPVTSPGPAEAAEALPSGPGVFGISSPQMQPKREREKGFWFRLNAEIVLYGSTDPEATVFIAEREIKLRRDGTFSYRFALPDGQYHLPIRAISADGEDHRTADLQFSRNTAYSGAVGAHPQDETLRPPRAENVA